MGSNRPLAPGEAYPSGIGLGEGIQKEASPKPPAPQRRFRRGKTGRRDSSLWSPAWIVPVRCLSGCSDQGEQLAIPTPLPLKHLRPKYSNFPPVAHRPSGQSAIAQGTSLPARARRPGLDPVTVRVAYMPVRPLAPACRQAAPNAKDPATICGVRSQARGARARNQGLRSRRTQILGCFSSGRTTGEPVISASTLPSGRASSSSSRVSSVSTLPLRLATWSA